MFRRLPNENQFDIIWQAAKEENTFEKFGKLPNRKANLRILAGCQNENHFEIVWQGAKENNTSGEFGKLTNRKTQCKFK